MDPLGRTFGENQIRENYWTLASHIYVSLSSAQYDSNRGIWRSSLRCYPPIPHLHLLCTNILRTYQSRRLSENSFFFRNTFFNPLICKNEIIERLHIYLFSDKLLGAIEGCISICMNQPSLRVFSTFQQVHYLTILTQSLVVLQGAGLGIYRPNTKFFSTNTSNQNTMISVVVDIEHQKFPGFQCSDLSRRQYGFHACFGKLGPLLKLEIPSFPG